MQVLPSLLMFLCAAEDKKLDKKDIPIVQLNPRDQEP